MRVCLLTPSLDAFKGGNHLPLLAALPDTEFTILTSRVKPANAPLPRNVRCQIIPARLGSYYYGFSDRRFASAVLRAHPAHDPFWKQFDVIHLNQTMGPALHQLKNTGVPVLFFIHHPVSADLAVALQESSFIERLRWRLRYASLIRMQGKLCQVFPVATVSQTAAHRIAHDYECSRSFIHVIPNGVDTSIFTPGHRSNEFDVIAVGSFVHPRKGFRYLADAYRQLSAQGRRIVDVGRRSAAQQAVLRGIPNLRSVGTIDHHELLSLLQRSSALISTSLYEGFGLSLIEALACGKPAFAFDAGAVREVLGPIDDHLVVPLRDTAELVQRITRAITSSETERAATGKRYRDAVMARYPLSRSAQELSALYQHLHSRHIIAGVAARSG